MKEILEKLVGLEKRLTKEKGPFDLFALFSSDDVEDKWDLVVSATWIGEEKKEALDLLSSQLLVMLKQSEFLTISKIVPLDVYDPRVKEIQKMVQVEHGLKEIREYRFYGFRVDTIYVITCKLQIDKQLMRLMWKNIIERWSGGQRAIDSKEILSYLKSKGESVPNYSMDRILEYLLNSRCIRGPRFLNSAGVKEHGAMAITWVDPDCRAVYISEQTD
jgi:hypothetical protein